LWTVDVECSAVLGADFLKLLLQADGNALGIQRIGFRENQRKQIRREAVDGIRGPQLAGHGLCGVAPSRGVLILVFCRGGRGLAFTSKRDIVFCMVMALRYSIVRRSRNDLDRAWSATNPRCLLLQGDVALQLCQDLLFELPHGALALEQVTDKKKG